MQIIRENAIEGWLKEKVSNSIGLRVLKNMLSFSNSIGLRVLKNMLSYYFRGFKNIFIGDVFSKCNICGTFGFEN